jgi:hypothetical protein
VRLGLVSSALVGVKSEGKCLYFSFSLSHLNKNGWRRLIAIVLGEQYISSIMNSDLL